MKVNWNLLDEVYRMQKNYHLPAYEVDAVTHRDNKTEFSIIDGCNGRFKICTHHDEIFVSKEDLLRAIQLIEEANKNEKTVEIITRALC